MLVAQAVPHFQPNIAKNGVVSQKPKQKPKSQRLLRLCLAPPSQDSLRVGFLRFLGQYIIFDHFWCKIGDSSTRIHGFQNRSGTVAKFRQYNKRSIQYHTIQYSTVQCSAIQNNTIQYNTIQYNAI